MNIFHSRSALAERIGEILASAHSNALSREAISRLWSIATDAKVPSPVDENFIGFAWRIIKKLEALS